MCIDKPFVSRSMHFGQFGGRCKSLQSGKSWKEGFNSCYSSVAEEEISSPSAFTAGEVRGLCPPALRWPLAIVRSSLATANQSPPNDKTQLWCSGDSQNPDLICLFLLAKLITRSSPGFEALLPLMTTSNTWWQMFLWTSQTITQNHNESAPARASQCFDCETDKIKMGCRKS